jgi:hypothetical protein
METLLMFGDPLSALIGGGLGLIGSAMNTSSTQAINAANLQAQTWSAQGGYLPGLVANANKAGLNPLAVLGSRGPNMAVQVGDQPGAGLQRMGEAVSKMDLEGRDLSLQSMREDIAQKAATNKGTMIQNAIRAKTLQDLESGKTVSGPEPASETSWPGMFKQWESANPLSPRKGGFLDRWANPSSWVPSADWMRFMPRSSDFNFSTWQQ